jgi:hypothetical protein
VTTAMSDNPYEPPKDQLLKGQLDVTPPPPTFADRIWLLTGGYLFGALITGLLSLFFEVGFESWFWILMGPLMGTMHGATEAAMVGWGGALMAVTHPINPTNRSACVTAVGLTLWFLSGMMFLAAFLEGF